jgi:hypothetical protein
MRKVLAVLVCVFALSSCASMGGSSSQLVTGIKDHAYAVKKVVLFGEGVTPQAAERLARESGAMVLSSSSPKPSSSFGQVVATLRAIADSGDPWEVMVAERARSLVVRMLARMKPAELSKFQGKLIVPEAARTDQAFLEQVKRVFGESVVMAYVQPAKN